MEYWDEVDLKERVGHLEDAEAASVLRELRHQIITMRLARAVVNLEAPPTPAWLKAMQGMSQPKEK